MENLPATTEAQDVQQDNEAKIGEAFLPMISERDVIAIEYAEIIGLEDNEENSLMAKDLGKKLVPIRTGMDKIHKAQKDFSLQYGRMVDAWKKKEQLPIIQMEAKLKAKAQYAENLKQDRINAVYDKRLKMALRIDPEYFNDKLGTITEDRWEKEYEDIVWLAERRKEKEAKIKEQEEAAAKIEDERAAADLAERKRIDDENAKLKNDADARDKKEATERAEREKQEGARQAKLAEEQAERDAAEKCRQDAEDKRVAKEKIKLDAIQKKLDDAEAERKRLELEAELNERAEADKKAANEKREANHVHRKRVNNAILRAIVGKCVSDESAKMLIAEIAKGEIANISINY